MIFKSLLKAVFWIILATTPLALMVCAVFAKATTGMLAQPIFLSIDLKNINVSINGTNTKPGGVIHEISDARAIDTPEANLTAPVNLIVVYLWRTCTGHHQDNVEENTPLWTLADNCTNVQYQKGYHYNFIEPALGYMPQSLKLPDASTFESASDASSFFVLLTMALGFSLLGILVEIVYGFRVTDKERYWMPRALVHLFTFLSLFVGCCLGTHLMRIAVNKINGAAKMIDTSSLPVQAQYGRLWLILMWCAVMVTLLMNAIFFAPRCVPCIKRRAAEKAAMGLSENDLGEQMDARGNLRK